MLWPNEELGSCPACSAPCAKLHALLTAGLPWPLLSLAACSLFLEHLIGCLSSEKVPNMSPGEGATGVQ